jgi:hypothetical protein
MDDVAAAAARAGLRFVIFTDHGNGTETIEPPSYRSSVLCIDGVEISTSGGHYAVVGMQRAPYPLAGEPRDVVDDVRRLGGLGFVAHGDSPKPDLRWTDWDAPFDGVEWLNLDTAWRNARAAFVARALLTYWFRPAETVALLATQPNEMPKRIEALNRSRRVLSIAGLDAHGYIAPSYAASFRALSTRVETSAPLSGDAAADARLIVDALRAGRHYTVIDGVTPPRVVRMPPLAAARREAPDAVRAFVESASIADMNWSVEHDRTSTAVVDRDESGALRFSYALGDGPPVAQFAAMARPIGTAPQRYTDFVLRAHADHPMRLVVEVRGPDGAISRGSRHSLYLDRESRELVVHIAGFTVPPRSALLLVVDTNNTSPGARGTVTFNRLDWAR